MPDTDTNGQPVREDRVNTKGGQAPDFDKAAEATSTQSGEGAADREDELLDEGLEETFPASDPVSAKHIT